MSVLLREYRLFIMQLNGLPIIGWVMTLLWNVSLAIPFWLCWTKLDIGKDYFYFLPDVYKFIGFWDCVFLFTVIGIIKSVFIPTLCSVKSKSESKCEREGAMAIDV